MCVMHKNTIKDLFENFRITGSVLNHNREASGRPVSVHTGEKIEAVGASVVEDPNKELQKESSGLINKTIIDVNNTEKRSQVDSL